MCTKNLNSRLRLANGSLGRVVGFQFPPGCPEHRRLCIDEESASFVNQAARLPDVVYVKLLNDEETYLPDLPPGVVPVRPFEEKEVQIQLPNRKFKVSIKQIPLVPAFALTIDKCQGLTLEGLTLGPLRHSSRRSPRKTGTLYVALSRAKHFNSVYLLQPLTQAEADYFKPDKRCVEEDKRLRLLEVSEPFE